MNKLSEFIKSYKYEALSIGLLQHLFIGIFITDLDLYIKIIWSLSMFILSILCLGVFLYHKKWSLKFRISLLLTIIAMPFLIIFAGNSNNFMGMLSIVYFLFFGLLLYEITAFLVRPGYINTDIVIAAICGYLLLIECSVFLFQAYFYFSPNSFNHINTQNVAATYIDLVYYCSILETSVGFGDITPNLHTTKLLTAFWGVVEQFYSVVLIGILISKFSSRELSKKN